MNRRKFIALAGSAFAFPSLTIAQTGRIYRVGMIQLSNRTISGSLTDAFVEALREQGFVVGRNLHFDHRYADGDTARVPVLVDELIALKPDVLAGFETTAQVMKAKTSTIPIVLTSSSDPVGLGLAQSLARPGGNVTGVSAQWEQFPRKHIEIMREILPRLSRLGLIIDTTSLGAKAGEAVARSAARAVGVTIMPYHVANRADFDKAFAEMEKNRPDALIVAGASPVTFRLRQVVFDNTIRLRIPYASNETVGGTQALFVYGPNFHQAFRDAARYAARILKGAKPADLPIEQPTKFEMVINLKTARAIGVTVPQAVLLRADRVIE